MDIFLWNLEEVRGRHDAMRWPKRHLIIVGRFQTSVIILTHAVRYVCLIWNLHLVSRVS
jgi:hypothetical protein